VKRSTGVLLAAISVGCNHRASVTVDGGVARPAPSTAAQPQPAMPPAPVGVPPSFAELAARADPAVVFVKTLQERAGSTGRRRIIGEGLGSAFVYDQSGLILTNNHVIEGASDIRVTFGKTREMEAKIVGRDPPTDVAVLRVDARDLPSLELGNSEAVAVGDWVVAIGNPFGLTHTVSAGIVSAKGRTGQDVPGLGDRAGYYNFLQTDASINPGNSGGPLLDLRGRVVGINTAIRARANNIGFAIPINMVKELLPQLLKNGKIRRSQIGLHVDSVVPEDAVRLGLSDPDGALVRKVVPGGPGDRAGLKADDVIIAFEGKRIEGAEQLRWAVSLAGVGRHVALRVRRGKRELEVRASLSELPESAEPAAPEPEPFGFP
jgi:serine protease Do